MRDPTTVIFSFPELRCQVGWLVSHVTGQVIQAGCGRWACANCGPRMVRRFRKRIAAQRSVYLATFTLEGGSRATPEGIRRLNAGWRVWLRWLRRQEGRKIPFSWVNEQGARAGNLHKHALIDCSRISYRAARRAVVRAHLGRVVDFRRVRDSGAQGYISKYLAKGLGVAWPRFARRCQTTAPNVREPGWYFIKNRLAPTRRRAEPDVQLSSINEVEANEQLPLALIRLGKTASLTTAERSNLEHLFDDDS